MMKKMKLFSYMLVLFFLVGCSFLYESPSKSSQRITDLTKADWQVANFQYTNQFNESFGLSDLKGEFWIANMVFARCPTVCQTLTPNMITLQQEVDKAGLNVQFVSFTVDPDFDDPVGLEKYGNAYGADFAKHQFLTGYSFEDIAAFSREAFKSPVEKIPDSVDLLHTVNFFLVNDDGKVLRIYNGNTDFNVQSIIKDLKSILK